MRNFVVSMVVVFLVLCVPWFCVAHAYCPYTMTAQERLDCQNAEQLNRSQEANEYNQRLREERTQKRILREQQKKNSRDYNNSLLDSLGW